MENPTEKTASSVSSIDERDLVLSMRKLDLIKELGDKQSQLQRIQSNLNQNTDILTRENQVLREFRKELDMLVQERMSHIEELRLIHADINIMETTIKQAEEERIKIIQESKRLLKDYQPMKEQINKLREILDLEKIPDIEDDETALMTMQLIAQQPADHESLSANRNSHASTTASDNNNSNNNEQHHPLLSPFIHVQQQINNSINSGSISIGSSSNNQSQASGTNATKVLSGMASNIDRSAFRQQPPPMKTCQSCQQQIHRNAPICPICKAKSRSRNPKKPKRRHLDINPQ